MIDRTHALKVSRQCELLDLQRSTFYYKERADHSKSLELMRKMGIHAIYRAPRTSIPFKGHKIYPYLLKDLVIDRPNQVWATDITYIPMAKGFAYLVAVMDWASLKVLAWRISNTLTTDFCIEALQEAIGRYGKPEIFIRIRAANLPARTSLGY